jgi:lactate 2-monooxygenase
VTLDTPGLAYRPADLDSAYLPFIGGVGCDVGLSDPVFKKKYEEKHGLKVEKNISLAAQAWMGEVFGGAWKTWEDIKLLRQTWDGPIVLKGIQHPEDARKALEAGCQGVVVSNHGGRQLDGAIGSLEMLPEIAAAVGDKMTVLFDSGIRTGVDVVKALSLGAKAVLVGRPAIYGMCVAGKEGAKTQLRGILADVDQSMGMAGIHSIKDCNKDMLRRVQYGGDVKGNN